MDLLSIGLILGGVSLVIGCIDFARIRCSRLLNIWIKLGLSKYKIKRHYKIENGEGIIVKVPIGGSFKELSDYNWKEKYPQAFIDVNVDFSVRRTGLVVRSDKK